MAEIAQGPSDPGIAPARIVPSHSHDKLLDIHQRPGVSGLVSLASVVLPGDQRSVLTKQYVGCYDRTDSG